MERGICDATTRAPHARTKADVVSAPERPQKHTPSPLPANSARAILILRSDAPVDEKSDHRHRRLLRTRRERPCYCRATEKRDECAAFHSITSSARRALAAEFRAPSLMARYLSVGWDRWCPSFRPRRASIEGIVLELLAEVPIAA